MAQEAAEIVDEKTGEVVAVRAPDALTEFGHDEIGLDRARAIANRLDSIIREKGLSSRIGNKDHIRVEAWCACASMTGLSPKTEWTREVRNPSTGDLEGYEGRVNAIRIATGEVVGAAEAGCFVDEYEWSYKRRLFWHRWVMGCPGHEERPKQPCGPAQRHAIESMSQTRATSKAIGQVLRWIPVLAGYSGTPAEEMPQEPQDGGGGDREPRRSRSGPSEQRAMQGDFDRKLGFGKFKDRTWREMTQGSVGGERHSYLEWLAEKADKEVFRERAQKCLLIISNRADKEAANGET